MQKKKNPDRTYGEKLISLFAKLLFTGERYSLTELARLLDCSKQTVLRLVDDITLSYQVPIRDEIRGNRKYVWIERARDIEPAALLSESEARTLQMCRAFTEHLLGAEMFREAERAVEKSCHHLPAGADPADHPFGVVRTGVIDYTPKEGILRTLIESMDRRRVCQVSYRNPRASRAKTFRIKPLHIFAHRESVYVHARLAKWPGKPYRTPKYDPLLAVQRFTGAVLTDTPFRRPRGYDFEKVMNQGFGIWTQKRFRVVLELTGWAAALARERTWSPDQKIERRGKVTRLSFWSTSEPEVMGLVLSFGPRARLVKPEGLVEKVEEALSATVELYH